MPHKNKEDPIRIFSTWFEEAKKCTSIADPTAMNLATASASGSPSNRMVLFKGFDEGGFVFYTNLKSRKGMELNENPRASLCFYWAPLDKQVRIEGITTAVSNQEADAYFKTRPLQSRLGSWASKQSQPLKNNTELLLRVAKETNAHLGGKVERPSFWSGFRVVPQRIEFWQRGESRLHERKVFTFIKKNEWEIQRIYP